MALEDPDKILALLRDPNVDSQEVADQTGLPRTEAARAARLLVGLAKARAEDVASLPAPLATAILKAAVSGEKLELVAALAGSNDKVLSKEAKRVLHVLRTRGVAVPEAPKAAPPPPPPPAEELFPCYASSVDGQGERAIWVARNVPGRGVEVGQAVVSDVRGLLELQVGVLGRKEYRSFGKDIAARGQAMGVCEVDPGVARTLVAEARTRNDAAGHPVPDGADAWIARIGPGSPLPDPASLAPTLGEDEERAAVAASGALHELPMLRGWLADEAVLRALAARLDAIAAGSPGEDEAARAAAQASAIAETVESWFDGARRALLSSRLLAVAVHLASSGDEPRARQAAAVARALAAGTPARDVPFARQMVEKAFPSRGSATAPRAVPVISAPQR